MEPVRWLSAKESARYLKVSERHFRQQVKLGYLPEPSRALGRRAPRWDVAALDKAMGAVIDVNPADRIMDKIRRATEAA